MLSSHNAAAVAWLIALASVGCTMEGEVTETDDGVVAELDPEELANDTNEALPDETTVEDASGTEVPYALDNCAATGGKGGLPVGVHDTKVAGLTAQVIVGDGYQPGKPTYLAFWLHGDGGQYRTRAEAQQFIRRNGWIFVGVQAPNPEHIWWNNSLWDGRDYVQLFKAVLDEMFAKYNVCRNTLFGAGGSGGPYFWTQDFFPKLGGSYPAHFLGLCGGGQPSSTAVARLGDNSNVVERTSFDFICGDADRLFPHVQSAHSEFSRQGFRSQLMRLSGAGHCNRWAEQGFPTVPVRIAQRWYLKARDLGIPVISVTP